MTVALTAVNLVALISCLTAFGLLLKQRIDRSEEGRAILVCLAALALMSLTGMFRRFSLDFVDWSALIAFSSMIAVCVWVLQRPHHD